MSLDAKKRKQLTFIRECESRRSVLEGIFLSRTRTSLTRSMAPSFLSSLIPSLPSLTLHLQQSLIFLHPPLYPPTSSTRTYENLPPPQNDSEDLFLRGVVCLTLPKARKVEEIKVDFRGDWEVDWERGYLLQRGKTIEKHLSIDPSSGNARTGTKLEAGTHTFEFLLILPSTLPPSSSPHSQYGKTTYSITARAKGCGIGGSDLSETCPVELIVNPGGEGRQPEGLEFEVTGLAKDLGPYSLSLNSTALTISSLLECKLDFPSITSRVEILSVDCYILQSFKLRTTSKDKKKKKKKKVVGKDKVRGEASKSGSNRRRPVSRQDVTGSDHEGGLEGVMPELVSTSNSNANASRSSTRTEVEGTAKDDESDAEGEGKERIHKPPGDLPSVFPLSPYNLFSRPPPPHSSSSSSSSDGGYEFHPHQLPNSTLSPSPSPHNQTSGNGNTSNIHRTTSTPSSSSSPPHQPWHEGPPPAETRGPTFSPGSSLTVDHLARLPSHEFLEPTTLAGTVRSSVGVAHEISLAVYYKCYGEEGGAGEAGKRRVFKAKKDVVIASCCCQPESIFLPAYTPSDSRIGNATSAYRLRKTETSTTGTTVRGVLAQVQPNIDSNPRLVGSSSTLDLASVSSGVARRNDTAEDGGARWGKRDGPNSASNPTSYGNVGVGVGAGVGHVQVKKDKNLLHQRHHQVACKCTVPFDRLVELRERELREGHGHGRRRGHGDGDGDGDVVEELMRGREGGSEHWKARLARVS